MRLQTWLGITRYLRTLSAFEEADTFQHEPIFVLFVSFVAKEFCISSCLCAQNKMPAVRSLQRPAR